MPKIKWYLSLPLIAICFALSFLFVPAIIGIVLLLLRMKAEKKLRKNWEESGVEEFLSNYQLKNNLIEEIEVAKKKREDLEAYLHSLEDAKNIADLKASLADRVSTLENKKEILMNDLGALENAKEIDDIRDNVEKQLDRAQKKLDEVKEEIEQKEEELVVMDDELLYQSFGFYDPRYDLENSGQYKEMLDKVRQQQKDMVKSKTATDHFDGWTLDGSKSKGRVMNNNNIKLTIRAFNNECDTAISKVKFNNIFSIEKRIKAAFNTLNNVNKKNRIEITQKYLSLKLEELYLAYEYEQKKQEEKEEQQRIREQMREEAKAQKEIQREKEKIAKEEKHFNTEIQRLHGQLENTPENKKGDLLEKIKELEEKLAALDTDKQNIFNREQNTRAGYVYIISNIGSFGENIYKIGMTRRLEPMDRVNELGSASVPFKFDVHAMVFSEDAPTLENALHQYFKERSVNKINLRKEFFNVSLEEIQEVVEKNHNKTVEFTKLAEAVEYRQSIAMNKEITKANEEKELVTA